MGGLYERAEWNVPLSAPQADAGIFADTPVGPVLADTIGEETLTAMFRTCFERQRINLQLADGSVVELAADRGEIHAGGKEAPLLEIELELKA
ncbi:MAG TPA: inorganic triphosphatase, partial [Firmicutes bacterium]|nr:inorganic triphosphatase [Bacillota bacterium]